MIRAPVLGIKGAVEADGNVPAELHMLLLVVPHGHQVRLVQQDVRRHESRVGEKARVDVLRVLGGLVLELGHAAQLAEHGIAVQHPAQLSVGGHVALDEEGILLGVQAAGDILGQLAQGPPPQVRRVLPHGDGVLVHDAVVAVIGLAELHPVADGAHIGTQGQFAAGLDAAEYDFSFLVHGYSLVSAIRNYRH